MQNDSLFIALIYLSVIIALLWAVFCAFKVLSIQITENALKQFDEASDEKSKFVLSEKMVNITNIGEKISRGASAFLKQEYLIMSFFIAVFAVVVLIVVDILGQTQKKFRCYASFAFILGSLASMLCGFIGMKIAVVSNYRTTYKAMSSLEEAFKVAYQAGCVMGFSSVGIGLGLLITIMLIYIKIYSPSTDIESDNSYAILMELVAGYGLGGSAMALFGRVGGGIFTKAADVGADLVGKIEAGLEEDSPRNPATIADNVGDNVGDIAGMGSDLFGSFAESTCAALVLLSNTEGLIEHNGALYYPLLISAGGIVSCFVTSVYGIYGFKVNTFPKIAKALNLQLLISTLLSLIFLYTASYSLPQNWNQGENLDRVFYGYGFLSSGIGLISGFLIGISTDYYTSHAYSPVRQMAESCQSGAALNIIYGLALGYFSTIIPIILIALTVLISLSLLGMFGVALSAIGMLSTLSVGLAVDAFGPICDNAGGISEMAELGDSVRKITDALDSAGNTTAAVGKGFAIGSACLVGLALYGAFITRSMQSAEHPIRNIQITQPWMFSMFLIGAMLPYAFSALTMKSVGKAACEMVEEVRSQLQDQAIRNGEKEPDYQKCIQVSTKASLREMILPALLVIGSPLFFGILFHPILLAGLLPGVLLSGVQLAVSMSNTGGAWDNTKKYIESGNFRDSQGIVRGKGSPEHVAAVIGDTVGDPLKDTSGPSLNILIKLMAIISLVFAGGFSQTALLANVLNIEKQLIK